MSPGRLFVKEEGKPVRQLKDRVRPVYVGTVVLVFCVSGCGAQEKAPLESQPDRIDVGCVHVGSVVDASVRVFAKGDSVVGIEKAAQAPDFLDVESVRLMTQTFGSKGTKLCCDVEVTFKTEKPGLLNGNLKVTVAGQSIEIPVRAEVLPREKLSRRVMVLDTPFDKFSTQDSTIFDTWRELVRTQGISADYLRSERRTTDVMRERLKEAHALILAEGGLIGLQDEEVKDIESFVQEGGTLIVMANAFYKGTIPKGNLLLKPHGLELKDSESIPPLIERDLIAADSLTEGVNKLSFHRVSPIEALNGEARILVKQPETSNAGFVAAAPAGKGMVAVIGESLWWNWLKKGSEAGADNARLLANLLTKSMGK